MPADSLIERDSFIELRFSPNVDLVSIVRRFVETFYGRALLDDDASSRLAVATHELLENAVKYATDGETGIRIEVRGEGAGAEVLIRTSNRVSPAGLASVKNVFDEIARQDDALAFYQTLMRRAANRAEGSGLGLGRVLAETGMTLRCEIDGDWVHVVARSGGAG